MAERVDVLIAGTGFGGSIAAYRLAESYAAAGANPNAIVMLERGGDYGHTDYKQSMDLEHLSKVYRLVQGQGGQFVTANARRRRVEPLPRRVHPLAAGDVRAARPQARRRARAPHVAGPDLARARSTRTTRASRPRCACGARRGTRSRAPAACGRRRSTPRATRATASRSPSHPSAASTRSGATPAASSARRTRSSRTTSPRRGRSACRCARSWRCSRSGRRARGRGATSRPSPSSTPRTRQPSEHGRDRVQGARPGDRRDERRADPHALAQRPAVAVGARGPPPRLQRRPRRGDRVRPAPRARGPQAARLRRLPQGPPDHDDDLRLLGRAARQPLRRHALQPPGDLPVDADELPLRRRPRPRGRPVVVGPAEEGGHRALGQPDRAAGDGRGHARRDVHARLPHRRRRSSPTPGRSRSRC